MKRVLAAAVVPRGCSSRAARRPQQRAAPRPRRVSHAPKSASQPVDARGFIHRWLVLEPVPVPGRLTESAVEEALQIAATARRGDALPARRRRASR